jgi:hypothetical protein
MRKPKNVREAVLQGGDIMGEFFSAEDRFTGPNMVVRHGEREIGEGLRRPFVEKIRFRPDDKGRKAFGNVRNAVLAGFDLLAASFVAEDKFTGPNAVIRRGDMEFDRGVDIPFTSNIEFGRPCLTAR